MNNTSQLDIKELSKWLSDNKVSRGKLAFAIGLTRSTIDNYFSRRKIPQHAQILIRRYMGGRTPYNGHTIRSCISIELENEMLNQVANKAVRNKITIQEWILRTIEEKLLEQRNAD